MGRGWCTQGTDLELALGRRVREVGRSRASIPTEEAGACEAWCIPEAELGARVQEAEAGSALLLFAVLVSNADTRSLRA